MNIVTSSRIRISGNPIGSVWCASKIICTISFLAGLPTDSRRSRTSSSILFISGGIAWGQNGMYLRYGNCPLIAAFIKIDMNVFLSLVLLEVTRLKEPPRDVALITSCFRQSWIWPGKRLALQMSSCSIHLAYLPRLFHHSHRTWNQAPFRIPEYILA
jgi:hypothetical protein